MIKKGSKVKYTNPLDGTYDDFKRDYREFKGIFEVIDVDNFNVIVRSYYHRALNPNRKYETDRYWVVSKTRFEEVPDEFQDELDKLFEF